MANEKKHTRILNKNKVSAQLIVKDLVLGYEGKVVSKDINFQIYRGNYLCIVGENGTGKSTLMKTILGLRSPLSGSIEYGDNLTSKRIGYLPQQTLVQKDFPASVNEIVMTGFLGNHGFLPWYSKEEKRRAEEIMEKFGIADFKDKCYRYLSGGQQQRVLLARALCATEDILLLDEPVSGLDPKVTYEMYELIDKLNKEDGITIIMVSHDIDASVKYASHILHLAHIPIFFGTKDNYMRQGFHLWKTDEAMLRNGGGILD